MKVFFCALIVTALCAAADTKLGKPLTLTTTTPIAEVAAKPDALVGKTIQVKGKVSEVCQMMGCWMLLVDPATKASIRIKVKDGEIVFPKDSVGKTAVAEGTLAKIEMTKEQAIAQAKHEAEENHKKFDPTAVKGPVTTYQIQGAGAVILEEK
jgi:hypothetical protein